MNISSFCCFFNVLKLGQKDPNKSSIGLFDMLPQSKDFSSEFSGAGNGVVNVGNLLFLGCSRLELIEINCLWLNCFNQMKEELTVGN